MHLMRNICYLFFYLFIGWLVIFYNRHLSLLVMFFFFRNIFRKIAVDFFLSSANDMNIKATLSTAMMATVKRAFNIFSINT